VKDATSDGAKSGESSLFVVDAGAEKDFSPPPPDSDFSSSGKY
jgi:hypothetical protein